MRRVAMAIVLVLVAVARPDGPTKPSGALAPINMMPYFSGETMTRWGVLPNVTDEFFGRIQCKGLPEGFYDVDVFIQSVSHPNGIWVWVAGGVFVKGGMTLDELFFLDAPDTFPVEPSGIYWCQPLVTSSTPNGIKYIGLLKKEQTQRQ